MALRNVTVLGATGSIGDSTLSVIRSHPERYRVFAVTGHRNLDSLLAICAEFSPEYAVLADASHFSAFSEQLRSAGLATQVICGADGLEEVCRHEAVDIVVAAIVGAAGLLPTLAAVRAGKRVLLANKEALVMTGRLFMDAVRDSGAELLPIDSEHNAIFQCLPGPVQTLSSHPGLASVGVRRILLTASGGPFREFSASQLDEVTPEQACNHPNWSMGQKISVDSATLMNKGLELIEACWLFDVEPAFIEVHIHPESIVHSLVEFSDGSLLAQLGNPDMRTPIAYGMSWPDRIDSGVSSLDLFKVAQLRFSEPDTNRFPCLELAGESFRQGGTMPATLNAANEIAVAQFLEGSVRFTDIPRIIEYTMGRSGWAEAQTLEQVMEADAEARRLAAQWKTGA